MGIFTRRCRPKSGGIEDSKSSPLSTLGQESGQTITIAAHTNVELSVALPKEVTLDGIQTKISSDISTSDMYRDYGHNGCGMETNGGYKLSPLAVRHVMDSR